MTAFYPIWIGVATGVALFTLMDKDAHLYQKIVAGLLVFTSAILFLGS